MSVMPQQNPLDSIVGADFGEDLARRIARVRNWLRAAEELLLQTQQPGEVRSVPSDPNRYAQFKGKNAVLNACRLMFTLYKRPMTQAEIIEELIPNGMVTGGEKQTQHQREWNIRQALSAYVKAGTLQLVNEKYGAPDWEKERFR